MSSLPSSLESSRDSKNPAVVGDFDSNLHPPSPIQRFPKSRKTAASESLHKLVALAKNVPFKKIRPSSKLAFNPEVLFNYLPVGLSMDS